MQSQEKNWLLQEKYAGNACEAFVADCKRLEAGEPLAYVIGHIPFLGSIIHLDNQPLIPRPETEHWVEQAITTIRTHSKIPHVLDLCAGSGCIGVTVTQSIPGVQATFAELDPTLLPTIEKNCIENNIAADRARFYQSDLFEAVTERYDYILSNPPYIDPAIDRAEASVKNYEPHLALYGGASGMEIIDRIITEAPGYLHSHGQLWLEHEPEQSAAIRELGSAHGFTTTTHKDQYGVERYSVLVLQ